MNYIEWKKAYFDDTTESSKQLERAFNALEQNVAVYPISADPPTWGHADIMMRAANKFSTLYWVVAENPKKESAFTMEDKLEMLKIYVAHYKLDNVVILPVSGSVAQFAKKVGAKFLVRGLRSSSDFQMEFELSVGNRGINKNLETVCMFTKPHYAVISSSIVRELSTLNEKISQYVHKDVEKIIKEKVK